MTSGHSLFPVFGKHRDDVLGLVSVKALWANLALAGTAQLRDLIIEPLIVPESMSALKLLESFKQTRKHVALVTDEFGTVQGLVTLVDVLQELVGDIPAEDQRRQAHIVQRDDGSWLVDAAVDIDELKNLLAVKQLPGEIEEEFQTLGGYLPEDEAAERLEFLLDLAGQLFHREQSFQFVDVHRGVHQAMNRRRIPRCAPPGAADPRRECRPRVPGAHPPASRAPVQYQIHPLPAPRVARLLEGFQRLQRAHALGTAR